MKTTELMIGDWVMDGNCPAQVTSLTCDGIVETTTRPYSNEELISPIPLTSEILEKNGLKKTPYFKEITAQHFAEDSDYDLELSVENGEVQWTISCSEYVVMKLHYVHELQHALRLCGLYKLADDLKI